MRVLPAIVVASLLAAPAWAAELSLKRVLLSSAGVGYYEYEAQVDGAAELGLDVKLDQVDDVLKSLVVFDEGGGVGGIELPGRDARRSAFGDVPFGPEALASPLAYLNSLQGVEMEVQGPNPMRGRLLRAEAVPVRSPDGRPAPDQTRVSLLTAEGLRQFVLETADSVQVADAGLRDRIARALAASRQDSAQDSRRITLRVNGGGARTVRVAFVAAAPLWKASYRLVLPAPGAGAARLQGWATLENAGTTDWSGVAVAVQYGNPVTFRQAIYRSYFVTRPEVPVEVLGRLLPDVDTRARALPAPPPPPAPAMLMEAPSPAPQAALRAAPQAAPQAALAMAAPAEPATAVEGTEETVFAVAAPVSLAAGHTASLPILDRAIPGRRVALARPGQPHPFAALELTNDTGSSLPAGVLTLYDAQGAAPYAGDARLGGLPAGETRLLAFAQDLRTTLAWRVEDSVAVAALTAAGGVLRLDRRDRQVTHATITAPANEPRALVLDVDRPDGATLAPGFAPPRAQTATAWRFGQDLVPGQTVELTYAIDRNERQAITLLDDEDAIATVLNLQGVAAPARAALQRIAALRTQEAAQATARDQLVQQRQAVEADEERLRANLAAVAAGDALRTRLVRQLDADETRLAQLTQAIDTANDAVARAHQALVEAIGALRL